MTELEKQERERKRRRRLYLAAAIVGSLLGLICGMLPPDYQEACHAITRAMPLTCGGN